MIIVGAGLAGLLAANMLARHRPVVLERQPQLPNNHSAVLRFKTRAVSDATGVPFRAVNMIKTTLNYGNPVSEALAYSFKVLGVARSDRSVTSGTVVETRYIAPPDLVPRLANMAGDIFKFNLPADFNGQGPYISTVPMPALMQALDYPNRGQMAFRSRPAVNIHAQVSDCDAYVSVLVPNPEYPFARISLMGDNLIIECPGDKVPDTEQVLALAWAFMGLPADSIISEPTVHRSHYAKLQPIDERARKTFLAWATDNHNVYSLGRFATWRPGLLLDDLVQDIRLIEGWIANTYDMRRNR